MVSVFKQHWYSAHHITVFQLDSIWTTLPLILPHEKHSTHDGTQKPTVQARHWKGAPGTSMVLIIRLHSFWHSLAWRLHSWPLTTAVSDMGWKAGCGQWLQQPCGQGSDNRKQLKLPIMCHQDCRASAAPVTIHSHTLLFFYEQQWLIRHKTFQSLQSNSSPLQQWNVDWYVTQHKRSSEMMCKGQFCIIQFILYSNVLYVDILA